MDVSAPPLVVHTDDPDGTRGVAAALVPLCRVGDVVLLAGDLGSGKTTFAQGFGAALGVREPVVSPTFTLVRQYPLPPRPAGPAGGDPRTGAPVRQFLHADLYRLDHRSEVDELGLGELVEEGGVAVVEWGEAAEPVLGDDWLRVDLEPDGRAEAHGGEPAAFRRTIRFSSRGPSWLERWPALEHAVAPWRQAA